MVTEIFREITVDVAQRNLFQAIVAKQNDRYSRFLKVTIVNNGNPFPVASGTTVLINAERADREAKSYSGNVNSDGSVTVPITFWMLLTIGLNQRCVNG